MSSAALMEKRPPTNSMDPNRYGSDIAELQGVTSEVYECLPVTLHVEVETSLPFQKTVSKFCSKASHR